MPNIPSQSELSQFFVRTVARASDKRGYYGAVHRSAIQLRSFPFLVYAQIARKADFRTRLCNVRHLVWPWRRIRTQRHVNRVLSDLGRSLLVRVDRLTYSLRGRRERVSNAGLRPIRFHVLAEAQDESRALLVRFLLFLAWSRVPWSWLRVGSIQKGLRVDRTVAAALLRWLRTPGCGKQYTRAQVRRAVFYSTVARLRHFRPDPSDPKGFHAQTRQQSLARSGNVHPPSLACMVSLEALCARVTGSGPPVPRGAVGVRPGAPGLSRVGSLLARPDAMHQGAGGTPPVPPGAPRRMEEISVRRDRRKHPQLTADKLIAGMPERLQADMRRRLRFVRRQ